MTPDRIAAILSAVANVALLVAPALTGRPIIETATQTEKRETTETCCPLIPAIIEATDTACRLSVPCEPDRPECGPKRNRRTR